MGILDFGDLRFWILYFGDLRFWILGILDFGEFGFWILGPESQIQNPKSPIQTFLAKFSGFWILDFGSLCSNSVREAPTPHILDFGFWDFGDFGFWIVGILDFGFWDFGDFGDLGFWGFWILGILDFGGFGDLGFWIFGTLCSRSLCAKFGFWNLGILDFGFWGFWILEFGDLGFWRFWEFGGLGILDWQVVTKFAFGVIQISGMFFQFFS